MKKGDSSNSIIQSTNLYRAAAFPPRVDHDRGMHSNLQCFDKAKEGDSFATGVPIPNLAANYIQFTNLSRHWFRNSETDTLRLWQRVRKSMAAEGEGEDGDDDDDEEEDGWVAIREDLEAAVQRGAKRRWVAGIEDDRMNLHITLLIFLSFFFLRFCLISVSGNIKQIKYLNRI